MFLRILRHDMDFLLAGIIALIFGYFYLFQIVGLIVITIGTVLCLVHCMLILLYSSDIGTIPIVSRLVGTRLH